MFSAFQTFGRLGAGARAVSAAWSPLALWPDGAATPGLWISPRDLTSQWADYTGTTPVAPPGSVADSANPVGLALDIRTGNPPPLGPELVTNGDFSDGTTGFTAYSGSTMSVSGGVLRCTRDATNGDSGIQFDVPGLIAGRTYWIEFDIVAFSGVSGANIAYLPPLEYNTTGLGHKKALFTFAGGSTNILCRTTGAGPAGSYVEYDNISVREIPGIHLSQATSTSRPVASARKNELLATAVLSTQNVTTTAIPYTISFGGAGTVTASGTHVGALTSGQTFTPTAGTLTLTVAGSVTTAQLERGSAVTSYQRVGATAADYDASAGPTFIRFDGVDDGLATATFSAGTLTSSMDCLMAVRRDSAGNAVVGLYESVAEANKVFGIAESGSASGAVGSGAGTPTVWVDGVQLTGGTAVTRGTLHTALSAGSWHILELRGLDLSTWTAAGFGKYTSYILNGALGETLLFPSGQDANRDLARAQMAAYFGVTLP